MLLSSQYSYPLLCLFVKSDCEAGSSKSKAIDHFLAMGFDEEKVVKAIQEHGTYRFLSSLSKK